MSSLVNSLFVRIADAVYRTFVPGASRPAHVRLTPVWAYPIVERRAD